MSNKKHFDAVMPGCTGPFFPPCLERAHVEFYGCGQDFLRTRTFEKIAQQVLAATGLTKAQTTDGYLWFWIMAHQMVGGKVFIAFPWGTDRSRADGTRSDRHMAVYTRGNYPDEKIEEFVTALIEARTTVEHDLGEA